MWAGKLAVVTGGASGIGLALSRRFGQAGMNVVVVDRDATRLDEATAELGRAASGNVSAAVVDVAEEDEVQALAGRVADQFGPVHLLCNNAGVIRPGGAWETSADDWRAVMDVNVGGVVNGIRAFVPAMLAHGQDCHVVNTASAAGLFPATAFAAYCASKAAVISLSEVLAADVAAIEGARMSVSVVCPGGVATELYRTEVRRRGDAALSESTGHDWLRFSDPGRTDQMSADAIADHVWEAIERRDFWVLPMKPPLVDIARDRLARLDTALRTA